MMHISESFHLPKGHSNFSFIDVEVNNDTELFIDPCLIEVGNTQFCREANATMKDYFDNFYGLYKNHKKYSDKIELFQYAHEINATKLGYGAGNNGKAKTTDGMVKTFMSLQTLIDSDIPMSKAIDLPIFIRDFAEDCMSDMLTNILFSELSKYTIEQCQKYSVPLADMPKKYHFWDRDTHSWALYKGLGLIVNGSPILLVPKQIVRHNFYYNTEQYFRNVVLERKQAEQTTYDSTGKEIKPAKRHLRETLLKSYSDILEASEKETTTNPILLDIHHQRLNSAYYSRGMSDEELDDWVYNKN